MQIRDVLAKYVNGLTRLDIPNTEDETFTGNAAARPNSTNGLTGP